MPNLESEATGRIRITKIPAGEAPSWIREAWPDRVLPCLPHYGRAYGEPDRGVLSREPVGCEQCGRLSFLVPQAAALEVLAAECDEKVVAWWREQGYPKAGEFFAFGADEVEIISGVTRQAVTVVEDDDWGNPDR